jgi:hypothetical protein
MKIDHIKNYKRGWIIGDFDPAILKTDQFEVAYMHHLPGEYIAPHFQLIATEYNVMISGKMRVNGIVVGPGDIFVFDTYEVADVEVIEETHLICVKTPSLPDDKIMVGEWRDME